MPETLAEKVATFAASVPDWAVADALNAPDDKLAKKRKDIPVSEARGMLMSRGHWGGIVLTTENDQAPIELRSLCITVRDSMLTLESIYTSKPDIYANAFAMVQGLLGAGLIDQSTADDLIALAEAPQSWADLNYDGKQVTARDVGLARGGKA